MQEPGLLLRVKQNHDAREPSKLVNAATSINCATTVKETEYQGTRCSMGLTT